MILEEAPGRRGAGSPARGGSPAGAAGGSRVRWRGWCRGGVRRAAGAGGAAGGVRAAARAELAWRTWGGRWRRPGRCSSTGRWYWRGAGRSWRRGWRRWRRGSPRPGWSSRVPDGGARAGWCSCSRGRAASGRGWGGSWPRRARCSRRGWPSARRRWRRMWTGRWLRCWRAPGCAELDRADVVQPVLWAVMVSLAAVWQAAGVGPGRGGGAFAGGDRGGDGGGDLVAGGRGPGGGAAQPGAAGRWPGAGRWSRWPSRPRRSASGSPAGASGVAVAAVNGPRPRWCSGRAGRRWPSWSAACEADGVRARWLPVDYASH